ncbi:MAG: DUF3987 domain-containing protein [Burkholderiales bacterium]|nr:DUF3987 domain-containing protein [Burkholderiales bacterium]
MDIDHVAPDRLADLRLWFARYGGFGYPTASSTPDAPRERAVLELSRDATRDECVSIGAVLARDLGEEFGADVALDVSVFRNEQPVYCPLKGAKAVFYTGEPLEVDVLIESATRGDGRTAADRAPAGGKHIDDEIERIRSTFDYLGDADDREVWLAVGMSLHEGTGGSKQGFLLWCSWAERSAKFNLEDSARTWASFGRGKQRRTLASLFYVARERGWRDGATLEAPAEAWGELLLPSSVALPELPCLLIRGPVGAMAAAVAEMTQTPTALSTLIVLSICATAVQKAFVVQPTPLADYVEPLSLWALCGCGSGTRKTAVLRELLGPVVAWQEAERKRLGPEIAGRFAARAVAEKVIERLKADAAKTKDRAERKELEAQIRGEKEAMPAELHAPVLVVSDITPEAAQRLLQQNDGVLSIISDEGALLDVMAGAYGDRAMVDVFLAGHSASPVHVERQSRSVHLERACLSVGLLVQPGVLQELGEVKRLRDKGVCARFLFALPDSTVGRRDPRKQTAIGSDVRAAYSRRMTELLDYAGRSAGITRVGFSAAAAEVFFAFAERVEPMLGPRGALGALADWGGKLPGAMARVAALMALADRGAPSPLAGAIEVTEVDANNAVALCDALIAHARAAFRMMETDQVEVDALALLRWIVESGGITEFKRSAAQKALEGRFRTVERLKAAAERLAEWNAISAERWKRNANARPSVYYAVNPEVHARGLFDVSRNSQ